MILPPAVQQNALAYPPSGNRDTWGPQDFAPPSPTNDLLPPALCPQPCPVRVDLDFCRPQPWPHTSDDRWGDPRTLVPPGVRTEPGWTPDAIKASPGGPVLVGPEGTFIYPAPELPVTKTGLPIAGGGVLSPEGAGVANAALLPSKASLQLPKLPWWGWAIAGFVAYRMLGGGR